MKLKYSTVLITIVFSGLLVFSSHLQAQQKNEDFSAEWKKVSDLQSKGLTKSALEVVENIYQEAEKNNNEVQIIKALLFKMNIGIAIEENSSEKNIAMIEQEIDRAKEPAKSILESIAAQLYWNYFQQNRFRIYQRTNTVNFDKKDVATWTADDLHKKIGELYLLSIHDKSALQKIKLEPFDAIIQKGNVRYLRPTLYDLLANRALAYFTNDERNITRPSYAFEITSPLAMAPANDFITAKFETNDSGSLHQKALIIYQQLLRFHQKDINPDAFIDADISRLNFVKRFAVMDNSDSLYLTALKRIGDAYPMNPEAANATFIIAQNYYFLANAAHANHDTLSPYSLVKAKAILNNLIAKFPKSEAGIHAKNLLKNLLQPHLNLTTEKINVPSEPFRTLVSFQNINTVYFRIVVLTPQLKKEFQRIDNDKVFQKLLSLKSVQTWKQDLPQTNDYYSHSVEIKVNPLPVGEYAMIASSDSKFSVDKSLLAGQYFYVSNISFINNSRNYFILNRTSGQPLADASVQVWYQRYDYQARTEMLTKGPRLVTNKNGYFTLPADTTKTPAKYNNENVRLEITAGKDYLFLDDYQYVYSNFYNQVNTVKIITDQQQYDSLHARIFLFTDRSIYRPGQKVYFKGIGVTRDVNTKKAMLLKTNDSIPVLFYDANGQKIDSLTVALNDFGSFHGSFNIPENKLNGEFRIDAKPFENSSVSFSVEEYKRPKFYTEFEKVQGNYRVGDTVTLSGFAKAYAGNSIDGAKVSYRVMRVPRFIYPWMFWRIGFPQIKSMEIAHGETTTDAEGKFSLNFQAIPDRSIDKKTDPVFDYKVEASVTDINGETRSADITVPVAYKALNLQIRLSPDEVIEKDSLKSIGVSSSNLSGEAIQAKSRIKIFKLLPPKRLIRSRFWETPDEFIYSKEEFIKYFPHDEYRDETRKESWAKGAMVFDKTQEVKGFDSSVSLDPSQFTEGWYVVEATAKDNYGQEVKDVKYFQVFDSHDGKMPSPQYIWNYQAKEKVLPGDKATIITGSSSGNVFLIQEINKTKTGEDGPDGKNEKITYRFNSLDDGVKLFDFSVTDEDRGGFGINQFFVKDNRFYSVSNTVNVPWDNKQLTISLQTYRDKVLPGSEEKWTVKITGKAGQKVAAEMLASMYDASLDQFRQHSWQMPDIWPKYNGYFNWRGSQNFTSVQSFEIVPPYKPVPVKQKIYDALNYLPQYHVYYSYAMKRAAAPGISIRGNAEENAVLNEVVATDTAAVAASEMPQANAENASVQIRKNFNETAFFYPQLRTDKDGNISFSFTMPEALTQWKFMALAHTKDLSGGYLTKEIVTQKDLMVQPNVPRFLREGDKMLFSAKIVNMSDKPLEGNAQLQLLNATTLNPVDAWFLNNSGSKSFSVAGGQSALVVFPLSVPEGFNQAVIYKIVAKAGNVGDGEEAAIPVVTNRMLVTESLPLSMQGNGSRNYTFEKLLHSGDSKTLSNFGLTVEYTSNPVWYAVQALPYLMEYPYECTEQTFNRFYANALAEKIVESAPKIKSIFEKWKTLDTAALLSNLQKNEELKSVLLEETPWVLQAQSENQQKKNIALLFDMVKMSKALQSSLAKLKDMQSPNGGFVWFKGGPDNRYMTQYIITGIGHLKKLNAIPASFSGEIKSITDKAIPYLDSRIKEDYDQLIKNKADLSKNNLSQIAIQYLYMRSFFPDYSIDKRAQVANDYFRGLTEKYWLDEGRYMQGMIALSLWRSGEKQVAKNIIRSLQENSITDKELGMYWKDWANRGYWWYQAPVESQSLMIEAFSEIEGDAKTIGEMKTWLLKNKQTNNWNTTKATADACYALLLQGGTWLDENAEVSVKLGNTTFSSRNERLEAGTGYFKRKIGGDKINPGMGNIQVTVSGLKDKAAPSWGAVYWQYFENLDKISFSATPLQLSKKLFIERNTDNGPVLIPVNDGDSLHIGDKIKARIELRADRDMEYVHMKDMRASCMEPTNVISQYKYQDGLGYYESTKDVSTNFFFGYLRKGTYVFEYPMYVTHAGNFSNGITTIQCMYAPEFTAHSEGVRVSVAK